MNDEVLGFTRVIVPVYTHVFPDGSNLHISTEPLRQMLLMFEQSPKSRIPRFQLAIDLKGFWQLYESNSFDPHRVMELKKRDPKTLDPVIYGLWADQPDPQRANGFLMDGRHRYALAALRGQKSIDAWLIPEACWRDFVMDGKQMTAQELRDLPIRKRNY